MWGQSEVIPSPVKPDRYPTRSEQAKWEKLQTIIESVNDKALMCRLLGANAYSSKAWGEKNGFILTPPKLIAQRIAADIEKLNNLKALVRKVEDLELAVNFRNGDIDIVEPRSQMDGFLLIVGGAIVLAGAIALAGWLWNDLSKCESKLRVFNKATDTMYCEKGTAEQCQQWKQYKFDAELDERQTLVDDIADGIKSIGKPIKEGAKWGAAAAIPLLALAFLWRSKK